MMNDPVRQFFLAISHCCSFEECWDLYTNTLKTYGILDVAYGIFPTLKSRHKETIVHTTYQPELLAFYLNNDGLTNDGLTNDYAHRSNVMLNDSFVWIAEEKKRKKWIENYCSQWQGSGSSNKFENSTSEQIVSVLRDFKVENGLCFNFSRDTTSSGVSLSATDMSVAHFKSHVLPSLSDLKIISALFHQYSVQFSRHTVLKNKQSFGVSPLTQSEIDTLKWLAQGLSLQAIADQKLFRSIESVNGYVRNAKAKLNANSRDQLIASAIMLGII